MMTQTERVHALLKMLEFSSNRPTDQTRIMEALFRELGLVTQVRSGTALDSR